MRFAKQEGNIFMRSEAQKAADKKYRNKKLSDGTKKQINATINSDDYKMIDDYCKKIGISKAKLFVNSAKYIINNNIDILNAAAEKTAPDE